jgi:hypothetical protein
VLEKLTKRGMEMECAGISVYKNIDCRKLSCHVVKARKEHVCCECRGRIAIGNHYEIYSLVCDGKIESYKTCTSCMSLREAFFDSSIIGQLWGDFYNYLEEQGNEIKWSAIAGLLEPAKSVVLDYIENVIWDNDS